MADIIAFPTRPAPEGVRYAAQKTIGSRSGITVHIMAGTGSVDDLIVVLGGTSEGSTTVAAIPAGEAALADVIAYAVLAALDAADLTWSAQKSVS